VPSGRATFTSVNMKLLPVEPAFSNASDGEVTQAGPQVSVRPYTWLISMPMA